MYKYFIKPVFFLFSPERIHHFVFAAIKLIHKVPGVKALNTALFSVSDPSLERTVFGLKFKNPVGLAAGFDKDAKLFDELANYGFGFIEIGTLTPKGQPGNPKPRLFRLPEDEALVNRMGFNNEGVEAAVTRVKNKKSNIIIGGNLFRSECKLPKHGESNRAAREGTSQKIASKSHEG